MASQNEVANASEIRRLHWGCGDVTPDGWINSDIETGPNIDISCDILKGLPIESESIDYISSQHALTSLKIYDQVPALEELRRVLKPHGVLRLCLPDFDKAIAAYQRGDREYFMIWDWDTIAGDFITQLLWYNCNHTLFTFDFAEELLSKAGFREVHRAAYQKTVSRFPEIIDLDNREGESFYVEAVK